MVTALQNPLRLAGKIAFSTLLCVDPIFATKTLKAEDTGFRLYPGISSEQSERSHGAIRAFYNGDLRESERILSDLDSMEKRDSLLPLSRLLQVATSSMQLQRNDAGNEREKKRLQGMLKAAAAEGLEACRREQANNGSQPTRLFIEGGIRGFMATLKIPTSPSKALSEGVQALKFLEKALDADSDLVDAEMGLGIFQCTAANSPLIARTAIKMMGRSVNRNEGLYALRKSAYAGQYTSVASQLFLIQFLSPYDDEMRSEKREIFTSLMKSFPQSAYYPFQREEEALCFYPDSFYQTRERRFLERRIRAAVPRDYAGGRYLNLVRYQYTLLNARPAPLYTPDTSLDLREYVFYPVFIRALRLRRQIIMDSAEIPSRTRVRQIRALRDSALDLLKGSGMNPSNLGLYKWRIREALHSRMWKTRLDQWDSNRDSTDD